ncbi:DUF3558 domain-containing protein [Corynebacterium suedekumii]|uniref:DUF3558 domain-containing protein n=1 Tax=Corynebacterium suedekumii TaxID=3049801 RepID=A0ABY8VQ20_9CORY|nr:DUF3558 domain-containing protein [Corynebacterium suedekumii]WIM70264.1 DUF3558 domain-containing protein [Corynebacterium suedekumii]
MPARRLLIAVCALALTACTPLIDDPSSPSTAAPAASETSGNESTTADAQAPTFELGEFDPEGDFELFDPCTEIPAEVLTEAGFGKQIGEMDYELPMSVMCSFTSTDAAQLRGLFTLTGDRNPQSKLIERGYMIDGSPASSVPGAYLHHLGDDFPGSCSAAMHTTRGRLIVKYGEISTERSSEEICSIALHQLEALKENLGD